MSRVTTIGLDLAKNVFHIHGVDAKGKVVLRKKVSRAKLMEVFANLPPCLVGMEVSCGANHWAKMIANLGHDAKLISPQYVKPYVKTNKNDFNDAEAICEAVSRPNMRFVPLKSQEQLDVQMIHRIREHLVKNRTATANMARGFLLNNGIAVPQGVKVLRKQLPHIFEDMDNGLSLVARDNISSLYAMLVELDEQIAQYDKQLMTIAKKSEVCTRLQEIIGVGFIIATATFAAAGSGSDFKNGRHFAAWLGLVPRQYSTGGKNRLFGISKRGNRYLRTLLIHGARSTVQYSAGKKDRQSVWLQGVVQRRGTKRAIVAQANKTARIIWALITSGEQYKKAA